LIKICARKKIRDTDRIRDSDFGFTLRNKIRVTDRIRNSDFGFTLRNKIRVADRIRNSDIGFTLRDKTRITDRIRNSDFGFTLRHKISGSSKSKSVSKKVIEGSRLTEALSPIACSAVLGGKAGLEVEKGTSGTYRCEASVVYHNALVKLQLTSFDCRASFLLASRRILFLC
jgi:hypothetical protein